MRLRELDRKLERCLKHHTDAQTELERLIHIRDEIELSIQAAQNNVNFWHMMTDDTLNDINKLKESEQHVTSA